MIRPPLQRALIAFALIFAAGVVGSRVPSMGGRLPLMLLPSGLAVAAMCRWGPRQWPAVLLAGAAIEFAAHTPFLAALGVGVGLAAGAALSCWILEWGGFDPSFRRAQDVPLFVIAAAIGMTLVPAFARLGYSLSGPSGGAAPTHWIRWWGNVAAGVLLVAPALVAANGSSLRPLTERRGESILWLLGLVICCVAIFIAPGAVGRPVIALVALILMVVGAIHFGLVISAAGAFVISSLTAISFEFNRGAFGGLEELQGLVLTWTFVAALNFVCLSITSLLAERDSAALAKLQAERRYAEIFDGSPQPIWVHDRRTLRFLMINEAALRQYGWSREEILSMSVAALTPPGEPPWAEDPLKAGGTSAEPVETRHLTRDGRILEVEVWSRSIDFADQPAELVFAVDVTGRRAFGRALLDAIAGEQLRIGQEMHDGLGQELTGLALSIRALANRAAREREAIAEDLDQLASLATGCIRDTRLIVQGLTPLTDADGNLEAALEGLAQRSSLSGTEVRLHTTREALVHIDLKARNHLYRIAQEAVQNALKHSGATAIRIELHAREESIRLGVLDNGGGMSAENPAGIGLGMRTMRFRASAIGAKLTFNQRDEGRWVVCEVAQPRTRPEGERVNYGRAAV
ncbi:MAG: MASE1 domain-containing protein [Steroidobacteraceae bacterium]